MFSAPRNMDFLLLLLYGVVAKGVTQSLHSPVNNQSLWTGHFLAIGWEEIKTHDTAHLGGLSRLTQTPFGVQIMRE